MILIYYLLKSKFDIVIEFGAKSDYMNRANIKTIKVIPIITKFFIRSRHAEFIDIV